MNTCDTCKWWAEDREWKRIKRDYPLDARRMEAEEHFDCRHRKNNSCKILDGFFVISTGPKFGCIHHKPK